MTAIWYEVLPVTLLSRHPMLIRPCQEKDISPWMIPNLPNIHPNALVINSISTFFGDIFDPDQTIVHSTSWRYEDRSDRLLLTYLAVLPSGNWLDRWLATNRIYIEPINKMEIQCGDHLFPPSQIGHSSVVAHALDHLASLNTYDPAIQAALEPAWQALLHIRAPKPAGYLLPV